MPDPRNIDEEEFEESSETIPSDLRRTLQHVKSNYSHDWKAVVFDSIQNAVDAWCTNRFVRDVIPDDMHLTVVITVDTEDGTVEISDTAGGMPEEIFYDEFVALDKAGSEKRSRRTGGDHGRGVHAILNGSTDHRGYAETYYNGWRGGVIVHQDQYGSAEADGKILSPGTRIQVTDVAEDTLQKLSSWSHIERYMQDRFQPLLSRDDVTVEYVIDGERHVPEPLDLSGFELLWEGSETFTMPGDDEEYPLTDIQIYDATSCDVDVPWNGIAMLNQDEHMDEPYIVVHDYWSPNVTNKEKIFGFCNASSVSHYEETGHNGYKKDLPSETPLREVMQAVTEKEFGGQYMDLESKDEVQEKARKAVNESWSDSSLEHIEPVGQLGVSDLFDEDPTGSIDGSDEDILTPGQDAEESGEDKKKVTEPESGTEGGEDNRGSIESPKPSDDRDPYSWLDEDGSEDPETDNAEVQSSEENEDENVTEPFAGVEDPFEDGIDEDEIDDSPDELEDDKPEPPAIPNGEVSINGEITKADDQFTITVSDFDNIETGYVTVTHVNNECELVSCEEGTYTVSESEVNGFVIGKEIDVTLYDSEEDLTLLAVDSETVSRPPTPTLRLSVTPRETVVGDDVAISPTIENPSASDTRRFNVVCDLDHEEDSQAGTTFDSREQVVSVGESVTLTDWTAELPQAGEYTIHARIKPVGQDEVLDRVERTVTARERDTSPQLQEPAQSRNRLTQISMYGMFIGEGNDSERYKVVEQDDGLKILINLAHPDYREAQETDSAYELYIRYGNEAIVNRLAMEMSREVFGQTQTTEEKERIRQFIDLLKQLLENEKSRRIAKGLRSSEETELGAIPSDQEVISSD